ncbi:MAG: DUF5069 domain-containing protein [Opitutaceae bacterium]|nr:DUF5069 domain-containing protein [Opitutaceae bacterium]
MSNSIIPMISSGTAGPLGVLHLPRLWLKVSLECVGKLGAAYPGIGQGYDQMTIDALGLTAEAVVDFIKNNRPNYPQFEAWIKEQPGAKLDQASIDAFNSSVTGFNHDDETRKAILADANIADDGSILDAINLNNLDMWNDFHDAELK